MPDRREFIRQSCAACAGAIAFAILAELESCKTTESTAISVSKNQVTVPLKQMEGKNTLLIKSASLDYDIALVKKPDGNYLALQMICPHRHNPVEVTETGFYCPSHGSEFDTEGTVLKGPAATPLKKFPLVVEKKLILISLSA
jgi:cytochrome b6-f complex iron-sulfur subunit